MSCADMMPVQVPHGSHTIMSCADMMPVQVLHGSHTIMSCADMMPVQVLHGSHTILPGDVEEFTQTPCMNEMKIFTCPSYCQRL